VLRLTESAVLEGFRSLRANVLSESTGYRTLLVTSAEVRDGKSTIVANLGAVVARSLRNVLIIDANLHQPVMHEVFEVTNDIGFSDVLVGSASLENALQQVQEQLYILSVGSMPEEASDLLNSDRMRTLLNQLARQFDLVLIDSPAVGTYSDAVSMAPLVDGVIVIAERARTRSQDLRALLGNLVSLNSVIAGVVINRGERRTPVTAPSFATTIARRSGVADAMTMRALNGNQGEERVAVEGADR
jgi:capsular exopolysaccharide synthesis family protein